MNNKNNLPVKQTLSFEQPNSILTSNYLKELIFKPHIECEITPDPNEHEATDEVVVTATPAPVVDDLPVSNLHVGSHVIKQMAHKLVTDGVKRLLVLSDTKFIQLEPYYMKLLDHLKAHQIAVFEVSDLQPFMSLNTLERAAQVAKDNHVDGYLTVGSLALIDFSKLVVAKAERNVSMKLNTAHLMEKLSRAYAESHAKFYSVHTVISPDVKVNARTAIINAEYNEATNKVVHDDYLDSAIPLFTASDDAHGVFIDPQILLTFPFVKMKELLTDVFYRLLAKTIYAEISATKVEEIALDLITLKFYLNQLLVDKNDLTTAQVIQLAHIIGHLVDERDWHVGNEDWTLFRLEAYFSAEFNAPSAANLAIITPYFIKHLQYMVGFDQSKLLTIGKKVFGTVALEGLAYSLLHLNQLCHLPTKYFDVVDTTKYTYNIANKILHNTEAYYVHHADYALCQAVIKDVLIF